MATAKTEDLLLLFERPREPVFTKKDHGNVAIEVPQEFLTDRYKVIGTDIQNRFSGDDAKRKVVLQNITPPNIEFALVIPRRGNFSLFIDRHREIAGRLIGILMNFPDVPTLMSNAAYMRDRLNPYLFQYVYSVVLQHRQDTRDIQVPSLVQIFPDQFVAPQAFPEAQEEATIVDSTNRRAIEIPLNYTASEKEEEQRLAYFREDIGVNLHHWHWHLVYPGDGPDNVVRKDRRGELFFYMHSQLIARYNVDRFAAGLPKVKNFNNFREPIAEAYFPKMVRSTSNMAYPPRASNTVLTDLDRSDSGRVEVGDLERWRDRILHAIDQRSVEDGRGNRIPLTEERGIDILGDIVEASSLTPNRQLYGNLHNLGHNLIAYSHDPENRYLEDYGVMGDVNTAMRDPIFYRWHGYIDTMFRKWKDSLPLYTPQQLGYNGITVSSVQTELVKSPSVKNQLLTYWQRSEVNINGGLDFQPNGDVFFQFSHLQHAPFQYRIVVNNSTGSSKRGTCRIFIAPKNDDRDIRLPFTEQRLYMIEMDKFDVFLNPGSNTVTRKSDASTISIPYETSFRQIQRESDALQGDALARYQFCGCGWPQHMLVPKGKTTKMEFDIFVMVSNYDDDVVPENTNQQSNSQCKSATIFCGLRDQKYPDRRPMGYPFDRPNNASSLQEYVNANSNMRTDTISIRFSNSYIRKD